MKGFGLARRNLEEVERERGSRERERGDRKRRKARTTEKDKFKETLFASRCKIRGQISSKKLKYSVKI